MGKLERIMMKGSNSKTYMSFPQACRLMAQYDLVAKCNDIPAGREVFRIHPDSKYLMSGLLNSDGNNVHEWDDKVRLTHLEVQSVKWYIVGQWVEQSQGIERDWK